MTVTKPLRASVGFFGGTARPALAAFGSIWIVSPDGVVLRVDPASMQVVESVAVGNVPSAIAAGAGSIWVTNSSRRNRHAHRPGDARAKATIPVGNGPAAVAVNAAGAWIANAGDNALVRVDTETNAVVETTPVGDGPAAVLATPTALWVANSRDGTVMRLDPRSGKVSKTIRLGGTPNALAAAGGQVWVAIAPPPPQSPPAGGARLTTQYDFTSLDPAFGSWLQPYDVCEPRDVPRQARTRGIAHRPGGRRGGPGSDGRRHDLHVQDPPRLPLLPAVERGGHGDDVQVDDRAGGGPALGSRSLADGFSGIVGYHAYVTGEAREISGIVARGRTLTIRLSRPDGGFLAEPRGRLGLRRPPRHAGRPRHERHSLRRSLLRRVVHAPPAAGSQAEPELRRRPPAPSRPDRDRDRRRPHARARARSTPARPTTRSSCHARRGRGWSRRTVPAARPRRKDTSSTSSPRRWECDPAHEHEQAALLGRAPAAGRELRDRPASFGRAGAKGGRGEPLQCRRAHGRLHSAGRRGGCGLPSVSPATAPTSGEQGARGTRARDGDHVHAQPLTLARGGADRPPQPEAARDRRPGEGVPARRLLHARHSARRAVRPGRLRNWFHSPDPVQILADFDGSVTRTKTTDNISHFNDPAFNRKLHAAAAAVGRAALPSGRAGSRSSSSATTFRRPRSR